MKSGIENLNLPLNFRVLSRILKNRVLFVCVFLPISAVLTSSNIYPANTYVAEPMKTYSEPRSMAMGESILALSESPSSMITNPAALEILFMSKLSFTETSLAGGTKYRFAGMCVPMFFGNLGLGMSFQNYAEDNKISIDGKEYSLSNSGDITIFLNYAFPVERVIPVTKKYGICGISLKYVHSDLADESTDGFSLDIGGIYDIPAVRGLKTSLVYRNVASEIRLAKSNETIFSDINLAFRYDLTSIVENSIVVADFTRNIADNAFAYSAGVSIIPIYPLTIRFGWKETGLSFGSGPRVGAGIDFANFSLNYAVSPYRDSSLIHQFGIDIGFGSIGKPQTAYEHYLQYHFEKARDAYERRDYVSARRQLEDILSVYPGHQLSKEYLEKIGQALDEMEQRKEIEINRWLRKATVLMSQNNLLKAKNYYERVLDINPENEDALSGLKEIENMVESFKKEDLRRQNKDIIIQKFNEALGLYQKGDYVVAKEKFKEIQAIDPENTEVIRYLNEIDGQLAKVNAFQINELYIKGMTLFEQGNYREAHKYFQAVLTAAPHRIDAQNYVLECQNIIEDEEKKKSLETDALEQKKIIDELASLYDIAMKYYENSDYENALKAFTISKKTAGKYNNEEYVNYSEEYIGLCKNALAEKHYKLGFEYAQRNKMETAAYEYRKAIEYNPEYSSARSELDAISDKLAQQYYEDGMNAFASGDLGKAKVLFKKSLFYKPDKAESQRALERIR